MSALTPVVRGAAIRAALRQLPDDGHHGREHPSGEDFRYEPQRCPGCMRSVLEKMIGEVERGMAS